MYSTGLELIEDRKDIMVEQLRTTVIESVHNSDNELNIPFSTYISNKLNLNFTYLSNIYTKAEGISIALFIIKHKIERAKDLIQYNELSFSEIAFELHYNKIGHLSNQFKKMTGTTFSFFKTHGLKRDINIENIQFWHQLLST